MDHYQLIDHNGRVYVPTYYTERDPETGQTEIWYGCHSDDPNRVFQCWADTEVNAQELIRRFRQADRLDESYGHVLWTLPDVLDHYHATVEQAQDVLESADTSLASVATERAWDVLHYHAQEAGLKLRDEEEEEEDESPTA